MKFFNNILAITTDAIYFLITFFQMYQKIGIAIKTRYAVKAYYIHKVARNYWLFITADNCIIGFPNL